eukprot:CAMPEP_0119527416 /NCGR_PEP_ID=MMETSP1344-20130328/41825_1 /TAXON_ID=236787 /ORGANISM="Florenciella parvula, Strain CCMP2471" /LENGTH=53 /DNA_ID=CAMNT_0007566603 /DNA_START=29 /DNA_END=186 /DNA_ORIENTATION=+
MLPVPSSSSKPPSATAGASTSNAAALSKMPSRSTLGRHTESAQASSCHRRHAV